MPTNVQSIMNCPQCGTSAPAIAGRCPVCGKVLPAGVSVATGVLTPTPTTGVGDSEAATRLADPTLAPPGGTRTGVPGQTGLTAASQGGPLVIGQNFGSRYHIIRLLGAGGMGSVYQAWDQELEVAVAVKVIRPDVAADPIVAQELERRFKRELLLARQVTDKHVVRIHDIGEIEGIKYITMPYIHGSDLATILRREGRLPVPRALAIARQIASGLIAAHDAGVVHRDLKPANIMVDDADHAVIMDFGIARSTSGATAFAMTVGQQVIGTVEYMAPEQAKGETVDQRADLYAFGLILRDMLLGGRGAGGTSAVTELMARMQHAPASLRTVDPTIPEAVDALVTRCLQPEAAARYQTAAELLRDVDRVAAGDAPAIERLSSGWFDRLTGRRPLLAATGALLVVLLAVVGIFLVKGRTEDGSGDTPAATVSGPAVTLAVLPFRNASSDRTLDSIGSSLSQVLSTSLGQTAQIKAVPPARLYEILSDLEIQANAELVPSQLATISDLANAKHVLWGSVARFGGTIQINAALQDLARSETILLSATAPNEAGLLNAAAELGDKVRESLARGSTDVLEALKSTAWKPSTNSFEALRFYNEGLQLTRQGSHQEALKRFEAATREDPNFALAYSGLAAAYSTLGYDDQAVSASRNAMSLVTDKLPPQERYRIAASHYEITHDPEKAIESYEQLVKASPADTTVRFELGELYEQQANLDRAREHLAKVVELDPKFVGGLLALGRVEIRRGNPQPALEPLDRALSLATQLENDEARADIQQAIGVAYFRLNRPAEALARYEESLRIKQRLGNKRGMAASHVQIGAVQTTLGNPALAEKSYRAALSLRREIGDRAGTSLTLIDLSWLLHEAFGRSNEALPLLQEALTITRETRNRTLEARALNTLGAVYAAQGQYSEAQTNFEGALAIRKEAQSPPETADTLHNLGDTLTRMGRYQQALERYVAALGLRRSSGDRRNAALASFGIGSIFDYQGRFGAAARSKGEALQAFRDLKQRDVSFVEILNGYGNSLSLSGRSSDATAPLAEALRIGEEFKNPNLIAQTLRIQAQQAFYAGDLNGALAAATKAGQVAATGTDRGLVLSVQADQAMFSSAANPTRVLASRLGDLASEADGRGLKALSLELYVARAEALRRLGDVEASLREADRALARAEALGLKVSMAKAHYVRASVHRGKDPSTARREYAAALRLLEEVKRDEGNENVLKRADLAKLYEDCVNSSR